MEIEPAVTTTTDLSCPLPPKKKQLEQLGVSVDYYELDWCTSGDRLGVPRATAWQLLAKESGQATGNNKPFGYLRCISRKKTRMDKIYIFALFVV